MGILLVIGIAGCAASLVDGTLGMGFGPTSSTILLTTGLTPATVSTTVNLAKVTTGLAGGAAHWRFGNIDPRLVVQLAGPGCLGAIAGVTVLANVDGERLRPYLATLLLVIGIRILVRFRRNGTTAIEPSEPGHSVESDECRKPEALPTPGPPPTARFSRRGLGSVAVVGGITNGLIGAWGPVVTPVLLHRDGLEPRVAIGSVNTAEIAVAVTASASLLTSLQGAGIDAGMLAAVLIGGLIAAPIAAWVVRHMAPRLLGVAAGGLLLVTNVRELADWADVGPARWLGYTLVLAACAHTIIRSRRPARIALTSSASSPRPTTLRDNQGPRPSR